MTTNDNGKRIKEFWLEGDGNALNECFKDGIHGEISLEATYHGDRDELWVVCKENNVETQRFNVRYVTRIVWL